MKTIIKENDLNVDFPVEEWMGKRLYKERHKNIRRYSFFLLLAVLIQVVSIFYSSTWVRQYWSILDFGVIGFNISLFHVKFYMNCSTIQKLPMLNVTELLSKCHAFHKSTEFFNLRAWENFACTKDNDFLKLRCEEWMALLNISNKLILGILLNCCLSVLLFFFCLTVFYHVATRKQNFYRHLIIFLNFLLFGYACHTYYKYMDNVFEHLQFLIYPWEKAKTRVTFALPTETYAGASPVVLCSGILVQLIASLMSFLLPQDELLIKSHNELVAQKMLLYSSAYGLDFLYNQERRAAERGWVGEKRRLSDRGGENERERGRGGEKSQGPGKREKDKWGGASNDVLRVYRPVLMSTAERVKLTNGEVDQYRFSPMVMNKTITWTNIPMVRNLYEVYKNVQLFTDFTTKTVPERNKEEESLIADFDTLNDQIRNDTIPSHLFEEVNQQYERVFGEGDSSATSDDEKGRLRWEGKKSGRTSYLESERDNDDVSYFYQDHCDDEGESLLPRKSKVSKRRKKQSIQIVIKK